MKARIRRQYLNVPALALAAFLALGFFATNARAEEKCWLHYARLGAKASVAAPVWVIGAAVKAIPEIFRSAYYPFGEGPYHLALHIKDAVYHPEGPKKGFLRLPFEYVRKDGKRIAGFVGVVAVLDHYTAGLVVTQLEFEEETREFDEKLGTCPYVLASSYLDDDIFSTTAQYQFRDRYEKHPRTFALVVENPRDLREKLSAIAAEHGPICGLSLSLHGMKGMFAFRDDTRMYEWDYNKYAPLEGLFAPDAKIRIESCLVGNGKEGESFLRALGRYYLPAGGTVLSTRAILLGDRYLGAAAEILHPLNKLGVTRPLTFPATWPHLLVGDEKLGAPSLKKVEIRPGEP